MLEQAFALLFARIRILIGIWILLIGLNLPGLAEEPKISEIKITGNHLVPTEEILSSISSYPGFTFSKDSVIADLQKLNAMGYFVPKTIEAKPYQKSDGSILLEYIVQENPIVTDVVVYGSTVVEVNAYELFVPLIALPENPNRLAELIRELESRYAQNGYLLARVVDIDIDPNGRLKIFVDEGRISKIVYKGQTKTQESYLNHLVVNTKVGEAYNESLFAKDYRRLQSTGLYSQINRSLRPDINNEYVLELDLTEKKTTSIGFGAGVSSGTGLFGSGNLTMSNLNGKGETLNFNALIGSGFGAGSTFNTNSNFVRRGRYTQIGLTYTNPYYRDSDYSLSRSISYSSGPNFNVDLSKQVQIRTGASAGKALSENGRFNVGAYYNYIDLTDRDRSKYLDLLSDNIQDLDRVSAARARREARAIRDSQIVSGHFVDLNWNYSYQNLDSPTAPRSGWRTRLGLGPSYGLGDIDSYTKGTGSVTNYIAIGKNSSLIINARGGYNILGTLPQFAKFRLGTSSGVRGYRQFSQLGVGSKLFITTAELRTPLYSFVPSWRNKKFINSLGVAAFADLGVIGGDARLNKLTDRLSRAASVGFGLRVNLPMVGSLRFDVGFPLVEALINHKFYRFNFGPADVF